MQGRKAIGTVHMLAGPVESSQHNDSISINMHTYHQLHRCTQHPRQNLIAYPAIPVSPL
jgi:hypothetical protein